MAVPRAFRLLAIVTLLIFCYLLYLIVEAPSSITPPAGKKIEKMDKDPNLECMLAGRSIERRRLT